MAQYVISNTRKRWLVTLCVLPRSASVLATTKDHALRKWGAAASQTMAIAKELVAVHRIVSCT